MQVNSDASLWEHRQRHNLLLFHQWIQNTRHIIKYKLASTVMTQFCETSKRYAILPLFTKSAGDILCGWSLPSSISKSNQAPVLPQQMVWYLLADESLSWGLLPTRRLVCIMCFFIIIVLQSCLTICEVSWWRKLFVTSRDFCKKKFCEVKYFDV